jgi:hypothetical protein
MTVIRPTFPVIAYEAPGALGSEQSFDIVRRSDTRSGWEYAETEGRAVAIRRLAGYDCQAASAPFRDQANINLAYPYSEQPVVYEAQASVTARCLATASLVRPALFEPGDEFAGIEVRVEAPEIFRVRLPGDVHALVAPGETTPKQVSLQGIDLRGPKLRYCQVSANLDEFSALGLTHIAGVAAFDQPAAFRLRRTLDQGIHVLTHTGVHLEDGWMGGPARRIEVRDLDHHWSDVTEDCQHGSIPIGLVEAWKERNQQSMVEFRINT